MKLYFIFVLFWVFSVALMGVSCQEKVDIKILTGENELEANFVKSTTTEKSKLVKKTSAIRSNVSEKPPKLICPSKDVPRPFFSLPCSSTNECGILGRGLLCCENRCLKGVQPPKHEPVHSPTFFGIIQQVCPSEPIPELWDIKKCKSDEECAPRICCPETLKSGENLSYCRTAQPIWETLPGAKQLVDPIRNLVSYMQCTPPPPPLLDLFPKSCQTPLDCFPNLCCQEGGRRYCRPPKRNILTLIADVGQRIIPTDAAREFIKRIS